MDSVGNTDYNLDLPSSIGLHNMFHVSQLKLYPNPIAISFLAHMFGAGKGRKFVPLPAPNIGAEKN